VGNGLKVKQAPLWPVDVDPDGGIMGQHVMARFVMLHSLAWSVRVADDLNTTMSTMSLTQPRRRPT